jgi:Leucine-rich repeat (LRR) protein
VDAGYTLIKSTTAFEGLRSLRTLVMRKAPLQSLERIETLPMLEQIYLSETQLLDLSPLLNLPRLQLVEVDESMRKTAEAVAEKAQFKIIYP